MCAKPKLKQSNSSHSHTQIFVMATIDEKTGGVRSGGSDNAPTWHTLETLKAIDFSAQLDLAQGLVAQCKHSNETAGEFEVRGGG